MNMTRSTTRPETGIPDDQEDRTASTAHFFEFSELTCQILITVAAAILTGVLALPFTMPSTAYAGLNPVVEDPQSGMPPAQTAVSPVILGTSGVSAARGAARGGDAFKTGPAPQHADT